MKQYFGVRTDHYDVRVFYASRGEMIPRSAFPITRAEAEAFSPSGRVYHISKLNLWSVAWDRVE